MGREVCRAVAEDPELELVAAVDPAWPGSTCARSPASTAPACRWRATSTTWSAPAPRWPSTSPWPTPPSRHMRWCAAHGVHAVVGTTGIGDDRCSPSSAALFDSSTANCVIAANFAIGAVLMMRFAELAAPFMDGVEIIELHHDGKLDAPSGTALPPPNGSARPAAARGADPGPPIGPQRRSWAGARGGEVRAASASTPCGSRAWWRTRRSLRRRWARA